MNDLRRILDSINDYLSRTNLKFLVIPFALLILFLVFYLLLFPPQNNKQPGQITTNTTTYVTPTITHTPEPVNLISPEITWAPKRFTESDYQDVSFQQSQLPDGSIKYTYPSSNPSRQNEMIVKDDTVIYQRVVISGKYVYNYTNDFGAPDYAFQGSKFYGPNIMVFVYLNKGVALVADANTTLVKEQLSFQPTNLDDFKNKYGGDVTNFTIVPTLPDE